MVVFTCNYCSATLQKPKVEKHFQLSCKGPIFLTCTDCLKDFREDEFKEHMKCISEEQRYGAKGAYKEIAKKGEVKQESWVEMIRSVIKEEQNIKRSHRDLLNKIANFSNVPRKKDKFMNFIRNLCGGRVNMNDVEAVWDIIEKYKTRKAILSIESKKSDVTITTENVSKENSASLNFGGNINSEIKLEEDDSEKASVMPKKPSKTSKIKNTTASIVSNGQSEILKTSDEQQQEYYRKEKRKYLGTENESLPSEKKLKASLIQSAGEPRPKFDFKSKILDILQAAGSVITPEKLKKKVKKLYVKETGDVFSEKVLLKYLKKLKQMENVECTDYYVKLK